MGTFRQYFDCLTHPADQWSYWLHWSWSYMTHFPQNYLPCLRPDRVIVTFGGGKCFFAFQVIDWKIIKWRTNLRLEVGQLGGGGDIRVIVGRRWSFFKSPTLSLISVACASYFETKQSMTNFYPDPFRFPNVGGPIGLWFVTNQRGDKIRL